MGRSPGDQQPPEDSKKVTLNKLLALVMCGVVAGAIIAAAAFPSVGVTALAGKAIADSFQNLPADLRDPLIPQTSVLLDRNGQYITSFYDENRTYIKLSEIPKIMQQAMVAGEDQRFFQHSGIDPAGMIRAFVANKQSGDISQGASTLSQQYVKMLLQYNAKTKEERDAATAPTAARKIREARYALAVEKKLSKEQILERYLNLAFFGNRAHGIAAASKAYFSKHPKDLTPGEAALLAGLVQSPDQYNPARADRQEAAKERRAYVLDRMVSQDFISKKDAATAKAEEIVLNPSAEPRKCENAPNKEYYGFYCSFFIEWVRENPQFGKNSIEREMTLERGGFRIQTALDPFIQDVAQAEVDARIPRDNPMMIGIVVIEPGTGRVLAMANNRTFSIEENPGGEKYPNTTIPLLSGTKDSPGYQAGSTFKVFTAVAALEQGIPLSWKRHSPQRYKSQYIAEAAPTTCGGYYCPSNYKGAPVGAQTMWSGLGQSINTYFIQLEEAAGLSNVIEMTERLGARMRGEEDQRQKNTNPNWGAFTLGVAQVTPLDMASAYATLAARGLYCRPTPMQSITNPQGEPLPYANPECKQVIAPDIADAATDMARCPVGGQAHGGCGSSLTAPSVSKKVGAPVAGKTGTTDSDHSAWFVGYTRNLAAAVVKVNPDNPNTTVNGSSEPVFAFENIFAQVVPTRPYEDFVPPTEGRINGDQVNVPQVAGSDPERAKTILENADFKVRTEPEHVESDQLAGRVAHTDPAGGSDAPKGSTVTIYISKGRQPNGTPTPQNPPPSP